LPETPPIEIPEATGKDSVAKRLLQIDKLKHRYWILLIRVYLLELSPNYKQKRFVSWFLRRKGRPRLKQKEQETIISFEKDNESNYSNHEVEEKHVDSNGKTYLKKKQQIQGSSSIQNMLIREVMENSIVYKNFKKFIEEAKDRRER
jgi:hypothetical protein